MGAHLSEEIRELLASQDTTAVLATVDAQGSPHVVAGVPLRATGEGALLYLEYFESSLTNKNLTRSIWFDGKVAIALSNSQGQSFQITGKPIKNHITGPLFLEYYGQTNEKESLNLAAVWEIEPLAIRNEGVRFRKEQEERTHPFYTHLDRLTAA